MSKIIASSAIRGAHEIVSRAKDYLAQAIAARGAACAVEFPDTAYSLPVIYSLMGRRVDRLADMRPVLEECDRLLPAVPSERVWLPYLGNTLDAGMATLFAFEVIEACKYLIGPHPVNGLWLGAAGDAIIRERGIEFVDGSAPGFAAVVGAAPTRQDAVRIARELQEKNLYVFIVGHSHGVSFAEQLQEAGVQLGWETRLVPFGKEISAAIYALGFANRVALSFGGVKPGAYSRNLHYNKDRIFAFVMALGEVTDEKYAAAAGAISYGFPTIADTAIPEILPTGICTYEHVVSSVPVDRIVEKCLEVRGCKIRIAKVPIPVAYGPAFEGERIRKEQTHVEFGGNRTPSFEYVTTRNLSEVEDGKITVIGPEATDVEAGAGLPLGIWVEVAGRKMQADFEPILERQIHHMINGAEGVWHMGQRDINWIRIGQAARAQGFTIAHLGDILHAKFLNDYPAIVDKVRVTLYTERAEVERRMNEARATYRARNQRMEALTDESVDTFYSCLLCQSFAPNHVCVITPERLGLCGAYNWLDGKAAYEIDPTGPNQPLVKGECLDPVRGQWENINQYVYANSKQSVRCFNAYSLLEHPMTSCGCFETIVAVLPELNGVLVVNREYLGDTPAGMKFSTLANVTGGGQQVPGFIGVGKSYIASRKFIAAEGGHRRIVWMPRELKETMAEELSQIGERLGIENFAELIADETIATDEAGVRAYMRKVNHPALAMGEIMGDSEATAPSRSRLSNDDAHRSEPRPSGSGSPTPPDNDGIAPPPERLFAPAAIVKPSTFAVPADKSSAAIRVVTLGGSGTRTSAVTIGGAKALPFRYFEGSIGHRAAIAMEVFDQQPKSYPAVLRSAYGGLLKDPAAMARFCVEKLGAQAISVRLMGAHPENGDRSPGACADVVKAVLEAVGVPLIVTGPNHFEKNNAVMKHIAAAFGGENLLLNWAETDNYKTIAAAAMGYNHAVVSQTPIDVNMCKQLNILLTNMGVPPEKIVIDPYTGALGYGLEYTYSVMERIRTSALMGDAMLAWPMLTTPGYEVARTKESRAPESAFPLWGKEDQREALLEIATAMSLLNAGADLLVMYHPEAARAVKRKIQEMAQGVE
jgi:acetyl-CoA synthase